MLTYTSVWNGNGIWTVWQISQLWQDISWGGAITGSCTPCRAIQGSGRANDIVGCISSWSVWPTHYSLDSLEFLDWKGIEGVCVDMGMLPARVCLQSTCNSLDAFQVSVFPHAHPQKVDHDSASFSSILLNFSIPVTLCVIFSHSIIIFRGESNNYAECTHYKFMPSYFDWALWTTLSSFYFFLTSGSVASP